MKALASLRKEASGCHACPLWKDATQTVFGVGPATADVMLVGEQPGDQEDRQGRPFVGPAGRIPDDALAAAGIPRDRAYVTNAVKHFKWKARGKRRIHDKPSWSEVAACRPWLEAEVAAVRPQAIVALGATAAGAVVDRTVAITRERGQPLSSDLARLVLATFHPSAVLRAQGRKEAMPADIVEDLRVVARTLVKPAVQRSA